MKTMHDPPHPGEVLKELYLVPLGLTVTEAAKALGISRKNLSAILNGKAGISTDMALRLSQCFNTTPESWLNMQQQYNLWHTRKNKDFRGEITVLYSPTPDLRFGFVGG
jgi:addiction module HigA family antidote